MVWMIVGGCVVVFCGESFRGISSTFSHLNILEVEWAYLVVMVGWRGKSSSCVRIDERSGKSPMRANHIKNMISVSLRQRASMRVPLVSRFRSLN